MHPSDATTANAAFLHESTFADLVFQCESLASTQQAEQKPTPKGRLHPPEQNTD